MIKKGYYIYDVVYDVVLRYQTASVASGVLELEKGSVVSSLLGEVREDYFGATRVKIPRKEYSNKSRSWTREESRIVSLKLICLSVNFICRISVEETLLVRIPEG